MWLCWSLPLRLLGFPLAFAFGCAALLSLPLVTEYAGAEELLRDGRVRRRLFPFREWLLVFLRETFPAMR